MSNLIPETPQHPQRYSIFRSPLFKNATPPTSYHKLPLHISFSNNYDELCVIDHNKGQISTRKTLVTRSLHKRDRSNPSKNRIFSEKKRPNTKCEAMSPVQLILSRREQSFERYRRHKIFGDYSTINSNEVIPKYTISSKENRENISYNNTAFLLAAEQKKQQPSEFESAETKPQNVFERSKPVMIGEAESSQILSPLEFAIVMFDIRLSQRIKHQRHRVKHQAKALQNLERVSSGR